MIATFGCIARSNMVCGEQILGISIANTANTKIGQGSICSISSQGNTGANTPTSAFPSPRARESRAGTPLRGGADGQQLASSRERVAEVTQGDGVMASTQLMKYHTSGLVLAGGQM
jgi:hypothetical protein